MVYISIFDLVEKGYAKEQIQQIAMAQKEEAEFRHEFFSFDRIGSDGKAYFLGRKEIEKLKNLRLSRDVVIREI